jgi:hypothetical protein
VKILVALEMSFCTIQGLNLVGTMEPELLVVLGNLI